jgi:hypothetical protein
MAIFIIVNFPAKPPARDQFRLIPTISTGENPAAMATPGMFFRIHSLRHRIRPGS